MSCAIELKPESPANQEFPVPPEPSAPSTAQLREALGEQQAQYYEDELGTVDSPSHLLGDGDVEFLSLSSHRFAELPMDTPFVYDLVQPCDLSLESIVQDGSGSTMHMKTPNYHDYMSGVIFQDRITLNGGHILPELSLESLSSASEQHTVGGFNDVSLAHTAQSSLQQSESQTTSGWQTSKTTT